MKVRRAQLMVGLTVRMTRLHCVSKRLDPCMWYQMMLVTEAHVRPCIWLVSCLWIQDKAKDTLGKIKGKVGYEGMMWHR